MPNEERKNIILGRAIIGPICEALGLDMNKTFQIEISIPVDGPVKAEVDMWGDERLMDVDWKKAKLENVMAAEESKDA